MHWQLLVEGWVQLLIKMEGHNQVCFLSYNSRGFGSLKKSFVNHLVSPEVIGSKLPIVCSQETFLLRENSYKLTTALPGFQVVINPAVKNSHDKGRPKNGVYCMLHFLNLLETVSLMSPLFIRDFRLSL